MRRIAASDGEFGAKQDGVERHARRMYENEDYEQGNYSQEISKEYR